MVPKTILAVIVAASGVAFQANMAAADDTGLAGIHDLAFVNKYTLCMTDHYHYGSSSGQKTKAKAKAAAIQSWRSFTIAEYGSDWGSFKMARSRAMSCSKSGATWGCELNARPCRKARRSAAKKK